MFTTCSVLGAGFGSGFGVSDVVSLASRFKFKQLYKFEVYPAHLAYLLQLSHFLSQFYGTLHNLVAAICRLFFRNILIAGQGVLAELLYKLF